jgi:FkbM family methyltransferase
VNRRLLLAAARGIRHLPNEPRKVRAVVAYRLAALPCAGRATIPASEGTRLSIDLADWTHRLYALGELDEIKIRWLVHLTPSRGLFVDVGANIGLYTCALAHRLQDGGSVIAVEPFPRAAEILRENVRLNRLSNVEIIEAAASNTTGEVTLFEPPTHRPASSGHVRVDDPGGWRPVGSARVIRLDEHLADYQVEAVKIDVEGHELAVLEGMSSVIDGCRPTVLSEAITPEVIEGIRGWSNSMDYAAFMGDRRGALVPYDDSPGDVLLVPTERAEVARPLMTGSST